MLDTVHYHSPVLPELHPRHNHARKVVSKPSKGDSPLQDTKKVRGTVVRFTLGYSGMAVMFTAWKATSSSLVRWRQERTMNERKLLQGNIRRIIFVSSIVILNYLLVVLTVYRS